MSNEDWWKCIPKLSHSMIGVNCVEISWEPPLYKSFELISHYQIFLNKISYKTLLKPNTNRIVIKGLAGGKDYDVVLMVYPKSQALIPQQSNIIVN